MEASPEGVPTKCSTFGTRGSGIVWQHDLAQSKGQGLWLQAKGPHAFPNLSANLTFTMHCLLSSPMLLLHIATFTRTRASRQLSGSFLPHALHPHCAGQSQAD